MCLFLGWHSLSWAGGPAWLDNGKPCLWHANPIEYEIWGGFGDLDPEAVEDLVQWALDQWLGRDTVSLRAVFSGDLLTGLENGLDFVELSQEREAAGKPRLVVVLDRTGSLALGFRDVPSSRIEGETLSVRRGDEIRQVFLRVNAVNTNMAQLRARILHEVGHGLGLGHAQLHDAYFGEDRAGSAESVPIMHPYGPRLLAVEAGPRADDVAWLSFFYPADRFRDSYGLIEGSLRRVERGPTEGINVVAIGGADHARFQYSVVSGYLKDGTSSFRIPVRPGEYTVCVEAVNPKYFGPSAVGPHAGIPWIAPEGHSEKSFEDPVSTQAVATVQVSAGQSVLLEDLVVGEQQHQVQLGETLWGLAEKYLGDGGKYRQIVDRNEVVVRDPDLILPGQILNLPRRSCPMLGSD